MRRVGFLLLVTAALLIALLGVALADESFNELTATRQASPSQYRAGQPITFSVNVTDGNPPFKYSWELGETFNTESYSLLEPYLQDGNLFYTLPRGTTNSRQISMTYTPPVAGDNLTAVCFVEDCDGKSAEFYVTAYSPVAWAAQYAQYVLGAGFLYDGYDFSGYYDNQINEVADLYTGPYMEWRRPVCFSLYDMNGDGIPELLMDLGGDYAMGEVKVFTYQNNTFSEAGSLPYHEFFNPSVSATPGMPGIYYSSGNMGSFDTTFNYLNGDKLGGELVFNEDYNSYDANGNIVDHDDDAPTITWTTNQRLINDWNNPDRKYLMMYPLNSIQSMGWWNRFLEAKFTVTLREEILADTVIKVQRLLDDVKNKYAILGYGYYNSLPSDWLATVLWIDLFQGHISSLDMTYNRRRFLFTEAIQMCTTQGKKSKFVKMNELPDGLVLMNKELKFEEAAYAKTVKNLCDPEILNRYQLNTPYFDKLISDTVDGKRSYLDTQQDLAQLGMSSADVSDIMGSIDMVDTIHVAGKMAKTYSNAKKAWNSVAEIANKWSLLNALDKKQMLQIAESYKNGSQEMRDVGEVLETFAKADKAGQIALITSDKMLNMGLDYLFDFLSATMMREMAKVSGSVATAAYALTYAAIDFLTGVGDLTKSNADLVFAGETVDHFWNNVTNFRDYLKLNPTENNVLRAGYAYVNYYTAAAELNEKYYDLVKTGDSAILRDVLNNDAMRQESARAKDQAPELRKLAQEMVQILTDSGLFDEQKVAGGGGGGGGW